ncbi:MAG: TIGR00341 family protein [Chloroflexi bacterium]|nr:TIGR00341 family protein [Chloroflexota bacterium]
MDRLAAIMGDDPASRVFLTELLATLPRVETPEDDKETAVEEEAKFGSNRVTREELYSEAAKGGRVTRIFIVFTVLSSIVASVGMIRDNAGVVIGAMVIAPLLGPSVALSLGATLGDSGLMKRAIVAAATGFGLALVISVAVGLLVDFDLSSTELISRTDIGVAEIALAFASGVAAALAFTTGASSALIGVMVAVALLPPTVALGLLTASGDWTLARGRACY